jgi:hypothetical protein
LACASPTAPLPPSPLPNADSACIPTTLSPASGCASVPRQKHSCSPWERTAAKSRSAVPIVSLAQAREKAKSIPAKRRLGLDHQPTPFFGEAREHFHASRCARIAASTAQRDERVLKRSSSLDHKRVGNITPANLLHGRSLSEISNDLILARSMPSELSTPTDGLVVSLT